MAVVQCSFADNSRSTKRRRSVLFLFATRFVRIAILAILGMTTLSVSATDMDPRSYSNIPKDLNFVIAGYANQKGNVAFSPALHINNAKLETHTAVLAYARSLDFGANLARLMSFFQRLGYQGLRKWTVNNGRDPSMA